MPATLTIGRTVIETGPHDLLVQEVDAIVNPANEDLVHGGGLAALIARAGGRELVNQSSAHPRVPTGEVAITTAGHLPQLAVIHAVGPIWRGGGQGEDDLLTAAHANVMAAAADRGYASVALPAISCGVFRFPVERAAPLAVGAVVRAAAAGHPTLRLVRFCLASDDHERAFADALRALA